MLRVVQAKGARVRALGSTVVQMLHVAAGRFAANVQAQGYLWDIAAAGLVVTEAGARATDWRGAPLFPVAAVDRGHHPSVVAMPALHRKLVRGLATLGVVVPRR